jgi:hypothetical protein
VLGAQASSPAPIESNQLYLASGSK